MKKRYILGFVLGIVTYVILHLFFNIYEAFAITMALVIGYSVLIFLKTYKFKVMLKNLNQFVDITDQSIGKIILDEKNINKSIHDIKNELFFVKNMLEKKEYDKAQDKIDNILLDCFKIYSPSICTNIYVDSFLSRFINTHSQIDFDIKIDVPDKIKMKPMDLSSLMLCLLQDDMIRKKGTMKFHMYANINELRINIEYPNKINIENDDLQILLKIIVNKYHGEIKIESNQIQCFLFFI